jgi:hypothetical protein
MIASLDHHIIRVAREFSRKIVMLRDPEAGTLDWTL